MNNMFKLKLSALGHPNPESFNCNDKSEYRSVVLWLEDQKIRHYKIEEREGLRQIESDEWDAAYDTYQKDLVSPVIEGSPNEQLNWLMSYAVRLEYADNAEKYKEIKVEQPKQATPNVVSSNPLDNLDFSSPAFKQGIDRISTLAGIGPHPDPKLRLAALAKILKTNPHPEPPASDANIIQQPSDVLKLLFVQDLRDLQTKINEALVAVQKVTADPRTDTKLGRVGR
ncbi:RNA transcription, translation and transport factor protein [Leguminivora glycinivorella]|uniref:RNA transcription, translation and transport factor protein n=1 Tax=Leguminivora glycinivorella TaxID=1035111 RepID=UPI00200BC8F4|nr:RNA transcription, translation and transport factor protein [Leguminivora glycinivorella]